MSGKLERFEKLANLVSGWLNWITVAGLILMSLITVIDVIGAKLFNAPIIWSFEVTALLGLVILVFAMAFTQVNRGHIEIEFATMRLPVRAQTVIGAHPRTQSGRFVSNSEMAIFSLSKLNTSFFKSDMKSCYKTWAASSFA